MEFALIHSVTDRGRPVNFPKLTARTQMVPQFTAMRKLQDVLHTSWVEADLRSDREEELSQNAESSIESINRLASTTAFCEDDDASSTASTRRPVHPPVRQPRGILVGWTGAQRPSTPPSFVDRIAGAAVSIRDNIQPQGDVHNDDTLTQRALNVVTSLPIIAIGYHLRKKVTSPEGISYANSMVAVGAAATAYHCSWGRFRTTVARKLDYYAISYSSAKLVRALWPGEVTKKAERVMHCVTPFRPFWLSTACALAMQAEFVRLGVKNEALRPALRAHGAAAAISGVAFACEDVLAEHPRAGAAGKHMHSLWHLASAYGLWTVGALVKHKEQMRAFASGGSVLYDSAASLQDLQYRAAGK